MYLFYVPGRGFNSPHLQNAFCNFNKTGIEPREASAEQVRGRGGTDAAGSERRRLEGAYRMYATESGSIPPISKTSFCLYNAVFFPYNIERGSIWYFRLKNL